MFSCSRSLTLTLGGLPPFRLGFPAKSVRDLYVLPSPVLQVIAVLAEAGQPSPLSVIQAALGTEVPEPVVVCLDSERQLEYFVPQLLQGNHQSMQLLLMGEVPSHDLEQKGSCQWL